MSRKRRIFDIDLPPEEDAPAPEPEAPAKPERGIARRGPMASAISENAEALRERREAEANIRAENDKLATEFVRLKREGLIVDRIPLDSVVTEKLIRDRKLHGPDSELEELKLSIREIGLSNPIRVEARGDGKYELIQGMRRLRAFQALLEETGDAAFATIPAGIVASDPKLQETYRRMVDENLVRKDISFAEMANLARRYAEDPANECPEVDDAVAVLFKSASYTKRSYIRSFAALMTRMEKLLEFPQEIPRNVGLDLKRRLDNEPGLLSQVKAAFEREPERDAAREVAILRGFADGQGAIFPTGKVTPSRGSGKPRQAKTTFQLSHARGVAKCNASQGRLELRQDRDFSTIDRRDLERAVAAFFAELDRGE